MREITGRDDVRHGCTAECGCTRTLGQVHFNKGTVLAAQPGKGIDRFDYACTLGPAAAHAAGQGHHSHRSLG